MKKKLLLTFLFLIYSISKADVIITKPNATGICNKSGIFAPLGDIIIQEGINNDFGGLSTNFSSVFRIIAPLNYTFNPEVGQINFLNNNINSVSINITKSFVQISITGNNTLYTLDIITISGLEIKTDDNLFITRNFITSTVIGAPVAGLPSGTILATSSSVVAGFETGWKDYLCTSNTLDSALFSPSNGTMTVSYPFGTNLGTFTGFPHTFTGSKLFINPLLILSSGTNIGINISYTFPNPINGCNSLQRNSITEKTITGVEFETSSGEYTFAYNSVVGISLIGNPAGGTYSGNGISGNIFIPSAIPGPYPNNFPITYTYSNPVSGCKTNFVRKFTVFNPAKVFDFVPTPPLEIENPASFTGWFCVNDFERYSMTLSTLTGLQLPETSLSANSGRSVSITAPNVPSNTTSIGADFGKEYGISFTGSVFGNINDFKFIPNLITSAGITDFSLIYNADIITLSGRSQPFAYSPQANQRIKIAPPTTPLSLLTPENQSFCLGSLNPINVISTSGFITGNITKWYQITGTGLNQKILVSTSSGSDLILSSLGLSANSPVNTYKFSVSQKKPLGCESEEIYFNITIKPIPTVPGVSVLISNLPKFCSDTTYSLTLYPNFTTTGYSYLWHQEPVTSTGQNTISTLAITNPIIITSSTGFYLTTELNGCFSNQVISTTTGLNPTVNYVPINFRSRPEIPTLIGSNLYCQGNAILPISVIGIYSNSTDFRWYSNTIVGSIQTISTGLTNNNGNNYFNVFTTSDNGNFPVSKNYFLKSNDITSGCKSLNYLVVPFNIIAEPSIVNIFNDNKIGFITGNLLNNKKYCFDQTNNTLVGISLQSSEINPQFKWYNNNTILGLTTTLTSYVSNSQRNITGVEDLYISQIVNGCESKLKKITIEINNQIDVPSIIGQSFECTGNVIDDLNSSTTLAGASVQWFSSVSGVLQSIGIAKLSNNSINPVLSGFINEDIVGSYVFASQVIDINGCSSPFSNIEITYKQTPEIPIIFDQVYCSGTFTASNLIAQTPLSSLSGQFMTWFYTPSNLTISGIGSTILGNTYQSRISGSILGNNFPNNDNIFTLQVKNYLNGCESDLTDFNVYIREIPQAPTIKTSYNKLVCVGDILPTISAGLGQDNLKWYSTIPGLNVQPFSSSISIETASLITTTSAPIWSSNGNIAPQPNIYLFYNTQTKDAQFMANNVTFSGCESTPRVDTVYQFAIPPVPQTVGFPSICVNDPNILITVTGGVNTLIGFNPNSTFKWFTNSVSGINLPQSNTLLPSISSDKDTNIVYWVSQVNFIRSTFSCQSPRTQVNYSIKKLPILSITHPENKFIFCNSDALTSFTGLPSGGVFTSTFLGFSTTSGSNVLFNPQNTFTGNIFKTNIKYSYTSISGCSNAINKEIEVNVKPTGLKITFDNENFNTLPGFCNNESIKDLILYSDQSILNLGTEEVKVLYDNLIPPTLITNKKFDPRLIFSNAKQIGSDMETVTVTFKYTINGSGCSQEIATTKELYAAPKIEFSENSYCEKTPITLQSSISEYTNINNLKYKWTGNAISNFNTTTTPSLINIFPPGASNIKVQVTSPNGCKNEFSKTFNVGAIPKAKFSFSNICFLDQTKFIDSSTVSNGLILNRIIDYGDGSELNLVVTSIFGHNYTASGTTFFPSLTITSIFGCENTYKDTLFILPKIVLTQTGNYLANFNIDNNWFSEGLLGRDSLNTWKLGIPNKETLNGTSGRVWFIDNYKSTSLYSTGQSSALNSPCFDFTNFKKPMVSFDLFNDTRQAADGAVLQYSIDGGINWNSLGVLNSGINWYNSLNILGNPGNNPQGWSSKNDNLITWKNCKHTLDEVRNQPSVRFRFSFASANQSFSAGEKAEGIAINNFKLGSRTKVALLEQFVNENSDKSRIVSRGNASIGMIGTDYIINQSPDNIAAISYHTSFPSDDRFNLQNSSDPSVRVLYNSIGDVPTILMDGNAFVGTTFSTQDAIMEDSLKRITLLQTLNVPDFDINLQNSFNNLNITILSNINYPANEDTLLVLQAALIERLVTMNGFNGQTHFENVLRKLIPDASGTRLNEPLNQGAKNTFQFAFNPNNVSNPSMTGFVVFLQNTKTKNVVQAAYLGPQIDNSVNIPNIDKSNLYVEIYPNPAQNEIFLNTNSFEIEDLKISDIIGKTKSIPIMKTKEGNYKLNTENLQNGFYNLILNLSNNTVIYKKFIIQK